MKSRRNFSQRTHPIRPIGRQTHVFGCFGPFCDCTNFGTKWAELVQLMHKLGLFRNERTRSTLLEPKLMFWGVSDRSLLLELPCKNGRTGAINAQIRAMKSRWNFLRWMHPIYPIRPQAHVLGHFGTFRYSTNFGAKRDELVQSTYKFVPRSRVGTFRNERTRSSPLDAKLMFWGIFDHFVTAWTSVQNRSNWCD
jgi:hypothetical protein